MTKLNVCERACLLFLVGASAAIASHAQTFTTLVNLNRADGISPQASLVQGTDGNLYGTTPSGGSSGRNSGSVFKVTPSGTLTAISFCRQLNCADGTQPSGGLVQATDRNFYGTTLAGGDTGNGTVFSMTPNGTLTTIYSFCVQANCPDGSLPGAPLLQASDGNLYGTTYYGEGGGGGTVFTITRDGMLTTLYSFCAKTYCADGDGPTAGLIQATNGKLYGTTLTEGANGAGGTVFEITRDGTLTTLYNFCGETNCADGSEPSPLVQASDGNFCGTTRFAGGRHGGGTVFRVTPKGTLTTLYRFCPTDCFDGGEPAGGLVQGSDGNLYGTTVGGGAYHYGTIFKITLSGRLTTLHSFNLQDGTQPYAGLFQATNGSIYGTTYGGGTLGGGTIFSLSVGLAPFISLVRDSGKIGSPIGILGQGFTGTTDVSVNGTAATFSVVSDTYLTAKVPSGATTGFVTVTTPSGTLTSNKIFRVKP